MWIDNLHLFLFCRKVEPVPIRRYYRRELESDNEEKILSESSTESESESRGGRSSFADQDDKRRRFVCADSFHLIMNCPYYLCLLRF